MPDFTVNDGGTEYTYGRRGAEELPLERSREHLTWEERVALQTASKALLVQLGVTDLGRWR